MGVHIKAYNYLPLREKLIECGVQLYPDSQVVEIRNNGVTVASSQELLFLKADIVVLAVGVKPENRLVKELEGTVPELYSIGDCVEPRSALEALNEGAEGAHRI